MNLVGKKILVINDVAIPYQGYKKVYPGIIVGCDPEIGICIAHIGRENAPWCVLDGPLSPNFEEECILNKEQALTLNNFTLNQLKSGYLSVPLIRDFVFKISNLSLGNGSMDCPYSM